VLGLGALGEAAVQLGIERGLEHEGAQSLGAPGVQLDLGLAGTAMEPDR
jgi:hypothetical protein